MMKIINDPVHGFINIPRGLLLNIVQHPLMQRLTRIHQLGMANFVYPGAQHTRFQHSLGAYHLTTEALLTLARKGVFFFDSEAEAVEAAILMHDIGHGPFSHVLENTLIKGITHEEISLRMMQQINSDLGGQLNLALRIFKDEYHKHFLHQIISSQLDMDRLDYLCRDSFFTGVQEGTIGCGRILQMLNVADDELVIEHKGRYSIENYLTSRRSMYWQVYLHKTVIACETMLINLLLRAKEKIREGKNLFAPPSLLFFLKNDVDREMFENYTETLRHYALLDDNDIWTAIKVWAEDDDKILRLLAGNLMDRRIFKSHFQDSPISEENITALRSRLKDRYNITEEETRFLYGFHTVKKNMYDVDGEKIKILMTDGTTKDICEVSELLNNNLSKTQKPKYHLAYQRE